MVEAVITLVVLGILAAFIAPRIFGKNEIDARGYFDATAAMLRYAQKSAVAQRREVCVNFSGSAVSLKIASAFKENCDTNLAGPDGSAPYALTPPGGVAYIATPANFSFLPSGEASADRSIQVANLPGKTLTVWAATGYVQED